MQLTNPAWVTHDGIVFRLLCGKHFAFMLRIVPGGAIYSIDIHPTADKLLTCGQGNVITVYGVSMLYIFTHNSYRTVVWASLLFGIYYPLGRSKLIVRKKNRKFWRDFSIRVRSTTSFLIEYI